MPCSKGMKQCRRSCLHRELVEEYRIARWAQIVEQDERTHGGRGERELEQENYVKDPITFKEWLENNAQSRRDGEA